MQNIVVSFTSYPERISFIENVLDSIIEQTLLPDKIVLYLSTSEFLDCQDIPLYDKYKEFGFEIHWIEENLGPHKKYFYAMQEYPDSIIITIDDDIQYNKTMIENLMNYHSFYPNAIIARRVHLITCTQEGKIAPYTEWKLEYSKDVGLPRMDLLATGCAGILYPPSVFESEIFNKKVFMEKSKYADDIWLKIMQAYYKIPIVLSTESFEDKIITNISNKGLGTTVNCNGGNDKQLNALLDYYNLKLGKENEIENRIFINGRKTHDDYNRIILSNLLMDLIKQEKVIVYGAGNVARNLLNFLKKQGYKHIVNSFVVEDISVNDKDIDDIPVKPYINYLNSAEKIVIGLWFTKQESIYETLISQGIDKERIIKLDKEEVIALQDSNLEQIINSSDYWENRYSRGGNSGSGSYGNLAKFKAKILNKFVHEHQIKTVIEFGCGDGNQLLLADYPKYIGVDVSKTAIALCKEKFKDDYTKQFLWSGENFPMQKLEAELALSLDVIYHLIEDEVYKEYINDLFCAGTRYVCIYSCNFDKNHAKHVKCRKFTDYIKQQYTNWVLEDYVQNPYPYNENDLINSSWSDFYFYKKIE